tara:strand:+ start:7712 stop:7861 length:150 start_codon:yes stop_codon:yes gene_type:complete
MVTTIKDMKIIFLSIQTVFEAHNTNTYDKILEIQKQYDLRVPLYHDQGE